MNMQHNSYSRAKADEALDLLGDAGFLEAYAATAKLLGTCFAYSPKEEASMRALAAIRSMDIASDWPFDAEAEEGTTGETSMRAQAASLIEDGLSEDEASLAQEYQRLFVGPGHLAAAPWGSVYLDRDKVLYGCSWVELRAWMREHGVVVKYDEHVPEDQIGSHCKNASFFLNYSATICCPGRGIISTCCWPTLALRPTKVWHSLRTRRLPTCKCYWE